MTTIVLLPSTRGTHSSSRELPLGPCEPGVRPKEQGPTEKKVGRVVYLATDKRREISDRSQHWSQKEETGLQRELCQNIRIQRTHRKTGPLLVSPSENPERLLNADDSYYFFLSEEKEKKSGQGEYKGSLGLL